MPRRRPILMLALVLIGLAIIGFGWWLWPADPAPPPKVSASRKKLNKRQLPRVPAAEPEAPQEPDAKREPSPGLAVPVSELGTLDTGDLAKLASVDVSVVYPDGELITGFVMILSEDCGIGGPTRQGSRHFLAPEAGHCTFNARRRDGALWAFSDDVEVDLKPGENTEVELVLPRERTGGLGVQITEVEEGIRIERVYPGTPADDAGLEEGDIIVEVDGLPTDALTADEFIRVMTGPEGTDIDFVIGYEADTGYVEEDRQITRASFDVP